MNAPPIFASLWLSWCAPQVRNGEGLKLQLDGTWDVAGVDALGMGQNLLLPDLR